MTRVLAADAEGIAAAAALLSEGEVVGMPTETVYGLAGLAENERAVARIFAAKERPTFDPLIVHLPERERLAEVARVDDVPHLDRLLDAFWPGPLTVVLPRTARVPDLVASGLPTVAVRLPAHPVARALLRPGGVPAEAIEALLGVTLVRGSSAPVAPGMLPSHYAPRAPLRFLHDRPAELPAHVALLLQSGDPVVAGEALAAKTGRQVTARSLSRAGDPVERARNLFAALRALDASGAALILAEDCSDEGLGHAIHDRLSRAGTGSAPEAPDIPRR